MKVAELKPSKYLKALVDIPKGKESIVTITDVTREEGEGDNGPYTLTLMHVQEFDKPVKLNSGMLDTVAELCGDDTDDWKGKKVTLFNTVERFGGKKYDVIRIKEAAPF
jgi:hypothetical protein